ncbi:hypothetical protein D3C81_2069130 [compost metagenome]
MPRSRPGFCLPQHQGQGQHRFLFRRKAAGKRVRNPQGFRSQRSYTRLQNPLLLGLAIDVHPPKKVKLLQTGEEELIFQLHNTLL